MLSTIWASPLPATLQGADGRLRDVNLAFSTLLGRPRSSLIGIDPIDLEPAEDREASRLRPATSGAVQRRLEAADGSFRWFRTTVLPLTVAARPGRPARLCLWQDCSAEVDAREHAHRAQDELANWFELSGAAMIEYDPTGLIVRCNAAFEALVDPLPQVLADTPPELQWLLGWQPAAAADGVSRRAGAPMSGLVPGAPPIERQVLVPDAEGRQRRLGARLSCRLGDRGERRIIAVLQDRSAEDDRDLARLEMGMLMDAASIGVATYDPGRGWLEPQRGPQSGLRSEDVASAGAPRAAPALQGIGRELVDPASMAEFERLQRALRSGERTEVRYAVQHPELGPRWLLTRVEPGALAGGRVTTSVVTLDVTDQERAQRRNDQLLRELSTILDSSTAGIAYLRASPLRGSGAPVASGRTVLVRCNRRFERMLGYEPGAAAGASLEEILNRGIGERADADEALSALAHGKPFEAELPLARGDGPTQWYSLSVRRADPEGAEAEAVAVLTDITRLKLQQAEQERLLRDRELMFNLSEVGIVYQRGARIERANEAMATLTGYAPPELTTLDAADLYEDARACVSFESKIEHGLREHGRFVGERPLRRRDGSLSWVQVGVRPVDLEQPEQGVICSFVDVDERRQSRETLASQADRTRSMLNSVLVGIVTVSEGGIQWMNRSARRMFAGELADFVGEPLSIVATPEPDHPLRRSAQMLALPEGRSETFECRLRGRDGREFWVVGNAVSTVQTGGGRELTVALLDIESRRQAENRIAQTKASLQRVIETAPLAIALFDTESGGDGFRVQQLNQTAAHFFGRPHDEVLGARLADCTTAPKAAVLQQWLAASLQDAREEGHTHRHEWHDSTADPAEGSVWDCRIAPLEADSAGHVQLLLVASDVTEQRAAERARLQAAIDQRELLVREVHHRIKNNLQGVAGLLQQNVARHPALASVLSEAVSQVQAIAQVYGLQVGASGPLPLSGLLAAIAQSVQRTFGRTIVFEPEGDLPHLLPEPESIPLALTVNELLTNAIKHSPGGDVRCTLRAEADLAAGVRISIASTAQLPPGFDVTKVRGGVSGLGLVRALLPRRHAVLSLVQCGDEVVAEVVLRPPGVALPDDAVAQADRSQSAA